ncbi:hypothetical protein EDB81DRAFT_811241, partial [Dactylonectria macrodidyma]
ISAPFSRRTLTTSTCPFNDASISGVHPSLVAAATSAPLSRNILTTSTCPFCDA